jgi:hypothetical protein
VHNLPDDAVHCYERAKHCAEKAAEAGANFVARRDFLDLEARWLTLAISYEFSEGWSHESHELDRRSANRAIIHRVIEYGGLAFDGQTADAIAEACDKLPTRIAPLEYQKTLTLVRQIIRQARHGEYNPVTLDNSSLGP